MFFHLILLVISVMTFLASSNKHTCDKNCADKPRFTPSRLVVQFGKPTSALCSVCQPGCIVTEFGIENPVGCLAKNGTEITWRVDKMTEWINSLSCYYTNGTTFVQCCSDLPVTVYKPPDNVSFSVHPDVPMSEGQQYTLQCEVQDVAPVKNLRVTFYRGQTALGELKSSKIKKDDPKPVSEVFTWNITSTKEDDGVEFWCQAKLELGAEGPQPPPVVESEKLTAAVHRVGGRGHRYKAHGSPLPLTLNCSVGNPPPSYTLTPPSRIPSPSSGSVFFINCITHADEWLYTCYVSNEKGSITVEFNVTVQDLELPSTTLPTTTTSTSSTTMITTTSTSSTTKTTTTTTTTTPNRDEPQREPQPPGPIILKEGNPLTLNCSSVGNPPPSYAWTFPSRTTSLSSGSVFFINSITPEDEGLYTCYVSNEKGSITVEFNVKVKADNLALIIGLVVAAVLLAVIVGLAVFISYHRYYKKGAYNLGDRIRLHTTHSSIPTAE